MIEILVIGIVLYFGLKIAWWMVKTVFVLGLAALVLGAIFVPGILVF